MQNTPQNSPNQNAQNPNTQNPNTQNANAQSSNQGPNQTGQNQDAMTLSPEEQRQAAQQNQRDESGLPGGGVGRVDVVGHTGVYPLSADEGASSSAKVEPEEAFGQGERGAAGYQDSGGSAIIPPNELGKSDKEVI